MPPKILFFAGIITVVVLLLCAEGWSQYKTYMDSQLIQAAEARVKDVMKDAGEAVEFRNVGVRRAASSENNAGGDNVCGEVSRWDRNGAYIGVQRFFADSTGVWVLETNSSSNLKDTWASVCEGQVAQ
jgi:hypothetical protein